MTCSHDRSAFNWEDGESGSAGRGTKRLTRRELIMWMLQRRPLEQLNNSISLPRLPPRCEVITCGKICCYCYIIQKYKCILNYLWGKTLCFSATLTANLRAPPLSDIGNAISVQSKVRVSFTGKLSKVSGFASSLLSIPSTFSIW